MTTTDHSLPRSDDPVAYARSIAPRVRELAAMAEADAAVPSELTDDFFANGLYSLLVPSEVGGGTSSGEATPRQVLEVLEEISAADGSTGWALMAPMAGMGALYSGLPAAGVEMLLASGNPITAGESAPTGTARRVDGGYIVSGRFRYASGSSVAGWFNGAYVLVDDSTTQPSSPGGKTIISGLAPREGVDILGNWDVMGLVATTSVDYELSEHFLPDELVRQSALQRGDTLHRAAPRALTTLAHTGVILGIMRGALEEFAEFARSKSRPPSGLLAGQETVQRDFAIWRTEYRAARALAITTFEELRDVVAAGGTASPALEADCRLVATHAAYLATDLTQKIYLGAGGDSLRNGPTNRLQRFFRDAHGASQHMLTGPHVYVEAGRIHLELPGLPDRYKHMFNQVFAPPLVLPD